MTQEMWSEVLLILATNETNITWNYVDYDSNIKIGIIGWVGSDAASLLDTLDSADKSIIAQSLLDDITNYPPVSNYFYWSNRYLSKDEGNSIIEALSTQTAESSQKSFFTQTLGKYEQLLTAWGCNPYGTAQQQKAFVFYCAIYHVNNIVASNICSAIGGGATLIDIYNAIMNKPEISESRNWNQIKNELDNWDVTEEPSIGGNTDPVWVDPGGTGDGGTFIVQIESQIQKIGMTGQQLIIYGKDNENGIVCFKNSSGLWIPANNTAAPISPTPVTPPEPDEPATSSDFEQMRQLWYDHEEDWVYGWGPGRLSPATSGYTDCSGCIWWAVNEIRPDLAESLGTYTFPQSKAGTLIMQGTLSSSVSIDITQLQEGDIVLISKSGNYEGGGDSHVEWYFGNDTLWGAGYAPLPHFSSSSVSGYLQAVSSKYSTFMIRRFLS